MRCEQMPAVCAEGDGLVHPGRTEEDWGAALAQFCQLAAGVVIEERLVVRVFEKVGIGGRSGGLRPGPSRERSFRQRRLHRFGSAVRGHDQGQYGSLGGPLDHPRRPGALPLGAGSQRRQDPRIAQAARPSRCGLGGPHLGALRQVGQEGDLAPVGRPCEVARESGPGQPCLDEGPSAKRVEAESVDPIGIEVPEPVGAWPHLQLAEPVGRLRHEFQRRQLGRGRHEKVVSVRAHVVQRRIVLVRREEILHVRRGEDVGLVVRVLWRRGGLTLSRRGCESGNGDEKERERGDPRERVRSAA